MPIKPYLAGAAFAPEAIQTMSVAFEEVCKTLDAPKEAEGYRRMIAGLIMVMARRGEHDPERLRDRVLGVAGMEKRKDSRDAPPDTAQPQTASSAWGAMAKIPADDVYAQWAYSE